MPQLDIVTYFSQFFWLCFFFLGFYFCLVQFFLPKMARILKYRQEKMALIEGQSLSYLSETQTQQENRWVSFSTCLKIQRKIAETETSRKKEKQEEIWENSIQSKTQANLNEAFFYANQMFRDHMISQNASLAYSDLMINKAPLHVQALISTNFCAKTDTLPQ